MYSPKIKEEFIPTLYKIALSKNIPMTKLVNRIVQEYLDRYPEYSQPGSAEIRRRHFYGKKEEVFMNVQ